VPEKCYYASFKILLNPDSRKNSDSGAEDIGEPYAGLGEVVQIEKTFEASDENTSEEDDKTLSLSDENLLASSSMENLSGKGHQKYSLMKLSTESMPTCIVIDSPRDQIMTRHSRSTERKGSSRKRESRYELTQSVDRFHRDRSPVFYLNPEDWIRTEGSSPLPYNKKSKQVKMLDSYGKNLDILSESEENLNSEIEAMNFERPTAASCSHHRNISDPVVRYQTPTLELIRESSKTPEAPTGDEDDAPPQLQSVSREDRSRSCTPGPGKILLERQRKTVIPILCSRSAKIAECTSPIPYSPFDTEPTLINSRPNSACGGRLPYRSMSSLSRLSQEDVTKGKFGEAFTASPLGLPFNPCMFDGNNAASVR